MSMMVQSGRFGGGAVGRTGTDPNFASVVLLLGFDGVDGSTTFTDESGSPKTVTASGNAQISTTTPKFLSGCLLVDGAGSPIDRAQSADNAAWDFGAGEFTVEAWVRFAGSGVTNADLIAQWGTGTQQAWGLRLVSGNLRFRIRDAGDGNEYQMASGAWAPAQDTWYHVAADRSGNDWRVYVDGAVIGSSNASRTINNGSGTLYVGYSDGGSTTGLNGRMDEVRITKGVGRYNGAFTAPTAAFPGA